MKEKLGEALLQDRSTRTDVTAEVFRTLDRKNFDDFEQRWRPVLKAARDRAASWTDAASMHAQDSHWEWAEKSLEAERIMGRDTFAVECAGESQGLMLVDVAFARLPTQYGQELVYIELLATAPWNRRELVPDPKYKGVGRVLIETAISLSVDLGFGGRIGLHSLPQSESWYRSVGGFADLGFDEDKDMHYFEMTASDAIAFISDK